MEDLKDATPLVVDNGSGYLKCGLGGAHAPSHVLPSGIGQSTSGQTYMGKETESRRGDLTFTYPIERGVITSMDNMEKLWTHAFKTEMKINPSEHPVLLTEPALNPKGIREKTVQVMCETFNFPACSLNLSPVLATYASGRTTGCAIDCGHGITHTVPVFEGFALPHAINRLDVGGVDLTDLMITLLEPKAKVDKNTAADIKEKLCYVALDYDEELGKEVSGIEQSYTLPDGKTITLGQERFNAMEALFNPEFVDRDGAIGVPNMAFESIEKCDMDVRRTLYDNIILCGGTTDCEGLEARVNKDLTKLTPPAINIEVINPEHRKISVWIGGSILSSLPTFLPLWITQAEYNESGSSIIHRKI